VIQKPTEGVILLVRTCGLSHGRIGHDYRSGVLVQRVSFDAKSQRWVSCNMPDEGTGGGKNGPAGLT
jgi:hypothetical protein